jgi:hypothetical protein
MLAALIAGETDPGKLAALTDYLGELGARIIAAEIGNDMSDRHTRCSEQSSRSWHRHPAFPLIRFLSWRLPRVKAVKRV